MKAPNNKIIIKPLRKETVIEMIDSHDKDKKTSYGKVIAIGESKLNKDDFVKVGDVVFFNKHILMPFAYEDKEYAIIDFQNVLAIVEDFDSKKI